MSASALSPPDQPKFTEPFKAIEYHPQITELTPLRESIASRPRAGSLQGHDFTYLRSFRAIQFQECGSACGGFSFGMAALGSLVFAMAFPGLLTGLLTGGLAVGSGASGYSYKKATDAKKNFHLTTFNRVFASIGGADKAKTIKPVPFNEIRLGDMKTVFILPGNMKEPLMRLEYLDEIVGIACAENNAIRVYHWNPNWPQEIKNEYLAKCPTIIKNTISDEECEQLKAKAQSFYSSRPPVVAPAQPPS